MRNSLVLFVLLFVSSVALSQEKAKKKRKLFKLGVVYNDANGQNFLFDDKDFFYTTNTVKFQFFYHLNQPNKRWDFDLIVQPQFQLIKHQLLNKFFVKPTVPNFEFLQEKFTQRKAISLYAIELGFQFRRQLYKGIIFEVTAGLGAGYIDVETERLSQGFTFLENLSLGLALPIRKSELYAGLNIGHVSNLNIQSSNDGFNIFGFEIGYRIHL